MTRKIKDGINYISTGLKERLASVQCDFYSGYLGDKEATWKYVEIVGDLGETRGMEDSVWKT